VLGPVVGLPGSFGVSEVDKPSRKVTITRCYEVNKIYDSGFDTRVSFQLGPFINRGYASTNYQGTSDTSALIFNVKVIGTDRSGSEATIEEANVAAPSLVPQQLENVVLGNSSSYRSKNLSDVQVSFQTVNRVPGGGEVHLYLPEGYSIQTAPTKAEFTLTVVGRPDLTFGDKLPSAVGQLELAPSQGSESELLLVAVRLITGDEIPAGSVIQVEVRNIANPMGGSPREGEWIDGNFYPMGGNLSRSMLRDVTVATAISLCSTCTTTNTQCVTSSACQSECSESKFSAAKCRFIIDSNYANVMVPEVQPGLMNSVQITMSTSSAGNKVVVSLSFNTTNPFPADGSVEVHLPHGYYAAPDMKYCSALLSQSNCPLPCEYNFTTGVHGNFCPAGLSYPDLQASVGRWKGDQIKACGTARDKYFNRRPALP